MRYLYVGEFTGHFHQNPGIIIKVLVVERYSKNSAT